MSNKWKSVIAEKRARQLASIPKEWILLPDELPAPQTKTDLLEFPRSCTRLLSPKELEITESSVDILLSNLANSLWSSVEVTTAFYKRAIIAHQLVNCLTEIFVDRALQRAQELDNNLSTTGKVIGPLHGLPISLKDQINISGLESTMGYISWVGVYPENNATLVDTLVSLGAVPFAKTNVPQTLMWGETFNNLFGRTSNPYNKSLTSGGSSGGEGALIAMKGSPLGIGSDIGGSIRIPSAFCGIYGLRPSAGRIPYGGCVNSMEGQDSIQSVLGPMSNSLRGLKIFTQSVIQAKTWRFDPLVIAKPWSEEEYKLVNHGNGQGLCFGIMWNDGDIVPHPPIIRGLELVKKALLEAGHQVMDWTPLNHAGIAEIADKVWAAGDMDDYRAILKLTDEPLVGSMDPEVLNEEGYHTGVDLPHDGTSAYELWQVQKQRKTLRQQYLSHWEKTTGATGTGRPIDAIICPVAPYAAPPHGKNRITQYTKVWNVLDYPSLVLPVTAVDELLDAKVSPHQFNNLKDEENHRLYDPTVFHGAPVAVQVVARTLEDEAVIAMAEIVDAAVRSYGSK